MNFKRLPSKHNCMRKQLFQKSVVAQFPSAAFVTALEGRFSARDVNTNELVHSLSYYQKRKTTTLMELWCAMTNVPPPMWVQPDEQESSDSGNSDGQDGNIVVPPHMEESLLGQSLYLTGLIPSISAVLQAAGGNEHQKRTFAFNLCDALDIGNTFRSLYGIP